MLRKNESYNKTLRFVDVLRAGGHIDHMTHLADLIAETLKALGRNTHGAVAVPVAAGAIAEAAALKVTAEGPHEIAVDASVS